MARTRQPYAVLTYSLSNGGGSRQRLKRLLATLRKQIRATDDVGWRDERSIAVLMPLTSALAARELSATLVAGGRFPPEVEVHVEDGARFQQPTVQPEVGDQDEAVQTG